jgi:hypothetical protein
MNNAVAQIGGQAPGARPRFRHSSDRNGGAENSASGDAWSSRWVTCIVYRAPREPSVNMKHPKNNA